MDPTSQTPLKTEVKWLLAVLLVSGAVAVVGAIYFFWRVLAEGANC
jgi:hypothetical protein